MLTLQVILKPISYERMGVKPFLSLSLRLSLSCEIHHCCESIIQKFLGTENRQQKRCHEDEEATTCRNNASASTVVLNGPSNRL